MSEAYGPKRWKWTVLKVGCQRSSLKTVQFRPFTPSSFCFLDRQFFFISGPSTFTDRQLWVFWISDLQLDIWPSFSVVWAVQFNSRSSTLTVLFDPGLCTSLVDSSLSTWPVHFQFFGPDSKLLMIFISHSRFCLIFIWESIVCSDMESPSELTISKTWKMFGKI